VSRAITVVMHRTHHANVYLDLSHLDPRTVHERFPGMAAICATFGLDLARDRIPVRPGAHYMIGGVTVDDAGRTDVPGLFAAGEVTSSGLHGANRLASNSLLEGLVYGARAGAAASAELLAEGPDGDAFRVPAIANPRVEENGGDGATLDLADIRNSLQSLMWRQVGVERRGAPRSTAARPAASTFGRTTPRRSTPGGGTSPGAAVVPSRCSRRSGRRRETAST